MRAIANGNNQVGTAVKWRSRTLARVAFQLTVAFELTVAFHLECATGLCAICHIAEALPRMSSGVRDVRARSTKAWRSGSPSSNG